MSLAERIAKVETRVDSMDKTLCEVNTKVNDIHAAVVVEKTNVSWLKKLIMVILGLILGGGIAYKAKIPAVDEAMAKEPVKIVDVKE